MSDDESLVYQNLHFLLRFLKGEEIGAVDSLTEKEELCLKLATRRLIQKGKTGTGYEIGYHSDGCKMIVDISIDRTKHPE